ncbi:LytTR family transcriptional regulator DNA-binding domain-containing protein [Ekhidna sp.]
MFIISGESPSFRPYEYNEVLQNLPQGHIINNLTFDSEGTLYFTFLHHTGYLKILPNGAHENYLGSIERGHIEINYIQKLNPDGFTYYDRPKSKYPKPTGLINKSFHSSVEKTPRNIDGAYFDASGNNFFTLENGITQIDSVGKVRSIPISRFILEISKLDESHFWVSSISGGVRIFDQYGNLTRHILDGLSISMIYADHEGGLWISTLRNGVFYVKNKKMLNFSLPNGKVGISDLAVDNSKNLWVGLRNGDIYRKFHGSFKLVHEATEHSINAHLFQDPSRETLYYSSDFYLHNDQSQDSMFIGSNIGFQIVHDSSNKLAYVNNHFGVSSITEENGELKSELSGIRVYDLDFFNEEMYLACKTGLFVKKNDRAIRKDSSNAILSSRLNDLCILNDYLVLASSGYGTIFYDEHTMWTISQKQGLTGDFVSKLYVEDSHTLWVCTNTGLNRIKFHQDNSYEIETIEFNDGLISNEVTDIEITRDTVWVATREGLSCFSKNLLSQPKKTINYFLKSQGVLINEKVLNKEKSLFLPYDKNRVEFRFSGISFNESEKLIYRYKLEGLEDNWNYTESRTALYSTLPDGEYHFIVELKGRNKTWQSERLNTLITIYPPYWKTWWFILASVIAIFLLAYLFFRYRVFARNRDLIRELLRQGLKKVNRNPSHILIKDAGKEIKIQTKDILFVKSEGNYLKVVTEKDNYLFREKIGNFFKLTPDPLEFIRVRRSYIVRIDKVTQKGRKHLLIGDHKIQIGETYLKELNKIVL